MTTSTTSWCQLFSVHPSLMSYLLVGLRRSLTLWPQGFSSGGQGSLSQQTRPYSTFPILRVVSTSLVSQQCTRSCRYRDTLNSSPLGMADRCLQREHNLPRQKFRPAARAREVLEASPGGSRKALAKAAKALVAEEVNSASLDHWNSLERQGHMSRCMDIQCAKVWAVVVESLPEEQINAALDVLPHNANLHLWKKKASPACQLCGNYQSLLHVLNNCDVARDLRRYNIRHDLVLQEIAAAIKPHL